MKTQIPLLCILLGTSTGQLTHAQTPFRNLDFERARVSGYSPGADIPAERAFPSSTVDESQGHIWVSYDGISLGGPVASICDSNISTFGFPAGVIPLDGKFSVLLFGTRWIGGVPWPATLTQTATVPSDANSVQIRVETGYFQSLFGISLDGQTINMIPIGGFQHYTIYGGDISRFAGQVATLSLSAPPSLDPVIPLSWCLVDDIEFSPQIVPEPNLQFFCTLIAVVAMVASHKNKRSGRMRALASRGCVEDHQQPAQF